MAAGSDETCLNFAARQPSPDWRRPQFWTPKGRFLSHASTLVAALECSLDFDKGGEIAATLAQVYRFIRARILTAGRKNDPEQARMAAETLGEIASAWASIR